MAITTANTRGNTEWLKRGVRGCQSRSVAGLSGREQMTAPPEAFAVVAANLRDFLLPLVEGARGARGLTTRRALISRWTRRRRLEARPTICPRCGWQGAMWMGQFGQLLGECLVLA
jgi:hypothetical protein